MACWGQCPLALQLHHPHKMFSMFKTKTPQEVLRENKRLLDRSIRELERERMTVEGQVKKTMAEMKKMAKAGQEVPRLSLFPASQPL